MIGTTNDLQSDPLYHNNEVKTYTFKKEAKHWYIDLPDYQEQGCSNEDLAMTEGAHKLLNTIANGGSNVTLRMSTEPFRGADVLELVELCETPRGGGIYQFERCGGGEITTLIWICDIALFVFGDLPNHIYVQRVNKNNQ